MYKELILKAAGNKWVKIQPPCSESELLRAEKAAGSPFPKELHDLLLEMNGDKWLFLSADEIFEQVKKNRDLLAFYDENGFERLDAFIFFAGNGCGDYYCYRKNEDGSADNSAVYLWNHEEYKCSEKVADNIAELITRYYNNEI